MEIKKRIKFPCGLELETEYKALGQSLRSVGLPDDVKCPLHNKRCFKGVK